MSEPVLEVRDLVVTRRAPGGAGRRGRSLHPVAGVSLALRAGDSVGLTGESGGGKSTLARAMAGLLAPTAGRVLVAGRELAQLRGRQLRCARRLVQMVFQDPSGSLDPRQTVEEALREALEAGRDGRRQPDDHERVLGLLDEVGLDGALAAAWPHEMSGGQRQRVAIARALAAQPAALVADEPTAALDLTSQARVLNVLLSARQRRGLALLLVSHAWPVVRRFCDRVAVMYLGLLVEVMPGGADTPPLHPYSRLLAAAVPSVAPLPTAPGPREPFPGRSGEPPSLLTRPPGCPFHPRCALAEASCRTELPDLAEVSAAHFLRCPPAARRAPRTF